MAKTPKSLKSRHTIGQRLVLAVSCLVILGCFAAAGGLIYAKRTRESLVAVDIRQPEVTTSANPGTTLLGATTLVGAVTVPLETVPGETFPPADPGAQNFLITGADNNGCVDPNSQWAGAADVNRPGGERSDTIMVMRIDPSSKRAAILSFPRDLWVPIDGGSKNRINSAYRQNDPNRLIRTVNNVFGITIDHFLQVDFCAFKKIVDAVGGITVPIATPLYDHNTGLDLQEAGCHTFGGDEALAYVRSRHLYYLDPVSNKWRQDGTSDYGRISRQQDFLRRALQSALGRGILNPSVARGLIGAAQKYVVIDNQLSIDGMLQFTGVLRNVDPAGIANYQVEGAGTMINGNSVIIPKLKGDNMKSILAIFQGTAPLGGAPLQVFETTTTVPGPSTAAAKTSPPTTPAVGPPAATVPATTVAPAPVDTVAGPEDNTKGVFPDRTATCP